MAASHTTLMSTWNVASSRPICDTTLMSPYPTVVAVTKQYHHTSAAVMCGSMVAMSDATAAWKTKK